MDSLIKTVLSNDLVTLKDYMNQSVQKHVDARIAAKKIDILAKINNTTPEKMSEIMAVAQ